MIDLSRGVTFYPEQDRRTGKWQAPCPACPCVIRSMTEDGLDTAVCAHMNERHFMPARGNA